MFNAGEPFCVQVRMEGVQGGHELAIEVWDPHGVPVLRRRMFVLAPVDRPSSAVRGICVTFNAPPPRGKWTAVAWVDGNVRASTAFTVR